MPLTVLIGVCTDASPVPSMCEYEHTTESIFQHILSYIKVHSIILHATGSLGKRLKVLIIIIVTAYTKLIRLLIQKLLVCGMSGMVIFLQKFTSH